MGLTLARLIDERPQHAPGDIEHAQFDMPVLSQVEPDDGGGIEWIRSVLVQRGLGYH